MYHFHVNNNEGESGIVYDMIILRELMIQIDLLDNIKCKIIQLNGVVVNTKDSSILIYQTYLTSRNIHEVVMQNEEPVYTRKST